MMRNIVGITAHHRRQESASSPAMFDSAVIPVAV